MHLNFYLWAMAMCDKKTKRKIIVQLNLVFCLHNIIIINNLDVINILLNFISDDEVPKLDCTNLKLNWTGLLTRCFLLCQSRLKRNICHSQTLEQIIFGINPCCQSQLSQIIIDSVQFNSSYIRTASVIIIIVCRFLIGHRQPGPQTKQLQGNCICTTEKQDTMDDCALRMHVSVVKFLWWTNFCFL